MRAWSAIVAGAFIALACFQRASRLDDAAAKARQLVVLTDARSQVAAADAAATSAFLVGGVESAEGRDAYLTGLEAATADLNAAAASGISDPETIAGVAEGVGTYRGTIEYARALNRQGFPIGAAYLRTAGDGLADDVIAPLDAEIADIRGSIHTNPSPVTIAVTVLALLAFAACFVVTTVVLYRHTRRYLNTGVVLGAVIIVIVLLVWIGATVAVTSSVNDAVSGPLHDTTQIAQVRADAFDARSAQNLALIARGSGQAYLQRLDEDLADARARLDTVEGADGQRISTALESLAGQLQAASDANVGGDYDGAVAIATGRTDGVGPAFVEFDQVSSEVLTARANAAVDEITKGRPWLIAIGVGALFAGALAAAAAWSGIAQRRKEYM